MAGVALIVGTLFWLVVFFCLMAAIFVVIDDDFGARGFIEAAIALAAMVVLGAPLSFLARKLSGKVISAAGEADVQSTRGRRVTRRAHRRHRQS